VRETQIIAWCDACQARGKSTKLDLAEHFTVDLGSGPHELDLCKTDRKALIDPLLKLVGDYGVVPASNGRVKAKAAAKRVRSDEFDCPECGDLIKGNRRNVISHLSSIHGMSTVEASKVVPTASGEEKPCPFCGYVTGGGTGFRAHIVPMHGIEAWEKIKSGSPA
jgi:predicted RNA-binding Zn-ribbon protein involved in translation (DUF1610 family)